jgi:hypothetical protein
MVKSWREPKTVKEVQQYLGLCNYYRKSVKNFSDIAGPLIKLTKKSHEFFWTKDCQHSFTAFNEALYSATILGYRRLSSYWILMLVMSELVESFLE